MTADEFNTATDHEIKQMETVGNRVAAAGKIAFTTRYILQRRPNETKTHAVLVEELHRWLDDTTSIVKRIQLGILGRAAGD